MTTDLRLLLGELKAGLKQLYDARLRGVYLFGSYARGDFDAESDCDLLIVLDALPRYGAEVDRTGELISGLALRHGVSTSRVFVSELDWQSADSPFLRSVRPEAIPA